MTSFTIKNARLIARSEVLDNASVTVSDGVIEFIGTEFNGQALGDAIDFEGDWLAPGFVDLQVNGGGGKLFNEDPSIETIQKIAEAHLKFGTTSLLPTLISDDWDQIERALRAVEHAIGEGVPGVLGLHLEGPFLNSSRKGIHDAGKFRRLDTKLAQKLIGMKCEKLMITIAPECCDPGTIEDLVSNGITVSAGHTGSSFEELSHAFNRGVTGVTHLFNAMTGLHHREPGAVGAAFNHESACCGLIADGHHIHPAALKLALRLLGPTRAMLVTDAMPSVGAESKDFSIGGVPISVQNGVCRAPDGTLAGCDLDMMTAVRNCTVLAGTSLPDAVRMASMSPAAFIGASPEIGSIGCGLRADLLRISCAGALLAVWQGGQRKF